MAIDKSANFAAPRKTVTIPGKQAQQQQQMELLAQHQNQQPVEVTPLDDGGAEINFDPSALNQEGSQFHGENLADILDDNTLHKISSDLVKIYDDCKSSRSDWENTYTKGMDLLGFKYEDRTQPFQGASGATHPVLAEAVTQFQALAYKELLPADGPVRTQIMGMVNVEKEEQAKRVKDFMNYQIMVEMKEYEPEFDQLLFNLPLSGSSFKKVYYDQLLGRCVSKFVPAEDLYVPYNSTSLEDTDTIVHKIRMSGNDLLKQQISGFYSDVAVEEDINSDSITEKKKELIGVEPVEDEMYSVLEFHTNLDLPGFEEKDQEGQPSGLKVPYLVSIDEGSGKVLSIRRNYDPQDPMKKKKDYFVHFKFLPGLGFYGFGLIHMIGGLSRTATSALRQLLDAGTLANLPAGFKQRGIRVRDEAQPLQPGEFRDVDAPGGNLADSFIQLPFKGPNATLLQLMDFVVQSGQRFAGIADMQVGDGNQSAAVGTTVALLERGSRVMSAIHKRMYAAMKCEFMLLAKCFVTYLPPQYPYDVIGGQQEIFQRDFDDRIDIIPVGDPNIFSQTQRISIAQTQLQLAMSNPKMHNMYQAYRDMYDALGIKNVNTVLPPPQKPTPMDPAVENMQSMAGKPFQAFPGQDHQAHMDAHLTFMGTFMARNNPQALSLLQKNCMEHIALMAQEQIQMEFEEEMAQAQQMQAMVQQAGPQGAQDPQIMEIQQQMKQLSERIESRKAQLIAQHTTEYAEEEKKVLNQLDSDPLLRLKSDEVQIKAQEEQRKDKEGEEKANMETLKLLQGKTEFDQKLDQDDEHAKLRAAVSLAKDGIKEMNATIKSGDR
tara:strand:+ start:172 stop:2658 length:2487 start_codon:yes stop_codon:yes gene_type:complete